MSCVLRALARAELKPPEVGRPGTEQVAVWRCRRHGPTAWQVWGYRNLGTMKERLHRHGHMWTVGGCGGMRPLFIPRWMCIQQCVEAGQVVGDEVQRRQILVLRGFAMGVHRRQITQQAGIATGQQQRTDHGDHQQQDCDQARFHGMKLTCGWMHERHAEHNSCEERVDQCSNTTRRTSPPMRTV